MRSVRVRRAPLHRHIVTGTAMRTESRRRAGWFDGGGPGRMGGTGRTGVRRRVRLQATTLATRLSRRRAPGQVEPAPAATLSRRAIGYTCVAGDAAGDLGERT